MTILQAEIKFYKSTTVGDTSANGGRMSSNQIASGAAANVFPSVDNAERVAGSTKYRKVFCKVANDADEALFNGRIYLEKHSSGADIVTIFPATQTDTQAGITGSENKYGCGNLNANVSIGATTLTVLCEPGNTAIFRNGEKIRVSNKTDIDDEVGTEQFVTIVGVPVVVDDLVTITFTPALENAYLASVTRVSSVYEYGDVVSSVDNLVVTTAGSGDLDIDFIAADNIGSTEQTFTGTFTNGTTFTLVGNTLGSLGSFTIGSGASPNNPAFTKPYIVIASGAFSGTFAAADTFVVQTHPAAPPVWEERTVTAGSGATAASTSVLVLDGETA